MTTWADERFRRRGRARASYPSPAKGERDMEKGFAESGASDSFGRMKTGFFTCSFWRGFLVFVLCAVAAGAAEIYKVGDTLEPFAVKDAKGGDFDYAAGKLSFLIVSYEMQPAKTVNGYLEKKPSDYLETHRAAFLADIHGMPGIGRFFALPKMKKYPHRILLADSDTLLARHPTKAGCVTVFSFNDKGLITEIRHLDPEKDLDALFPGAETETDAK